MATRPCEGTQEQLLEKVITTEFCFVIFKFYPRRFKYTLKKAERYKEPLCITSSSFKKEQFKASLVLSLPTLFGSKLQTHLGHEYFIDI